MQNPYCSLSSVLGKRGDEWPVLFVTERGNDTYRGSSDKLDPERLEAVSRVDLHGVGQRSYVSVSKDCGKQVTPLPRVKVHRLRSTALGNYWLLGGLVPVLQQTSKLPRHTLVTGSYSQRDIKGD